MRAMIVTDKIDLIMTTLINHHNNNLKSQTQLMMKTQINKEFMSKMRIMQMMINCIEDI